MSALPPFLEGPWITEGDSSILFWSQVGRPFTSPVLLVLCLALIWQRVFRFAELFGLLNKLYIDEYGPNQQDSNNVFSLVSLLITFLY